MRPTPTSCAYLHFEKAPHGVVVPTASLAATAGGASKDFNESDIWGRSSLPSWRAGQFLAARKASPVKLAPNDRAAYESLPVKNLDWSKILGSEYRPGYHYGRGGGGDWSELDDDEDSVELVAGRRRAVLLSLNGVVNGTLKVRDAVWKQTTSYTKKIRQKGHITTLYGDGKKRSI